HRAGRQRPDGARGVAARPQLPPVGAVAAPAPLRPVGTPDLPRRLARWPGPTGRRLRSRRVHRPRLGRDPGGAGHGRRRPRPAGPGARPVRGGRCRLDRRGGAGDRPLLLPALPRGARHRRPAGRVLLRRLRLRRGPGRSVRRGLGRRAGLARRLGARPGVRGPGAAAGRPVGRGPHPRPLGRPGARGRAGAPRVNRPARLATEWLRQTYGGLVELSAPDPVHETPAALLVACRSVTQPGFPRTPMLAASVVVPRYSGLPFHPSPSAPLADLDSAPAWVLADRLVSQPKRLNIRGRTVALHHRIDGTEASPLPW